MPKPPLFAPRIWIGMQAKAWFRLIFRHRCRFNDWRLWLVALAVSCYMLPLALLGGLFRLLGKFELRGVDVKQPPIFVLGHWRSGTTMLHELMVLDQRHGSPTTYACLLPNIFMHTEHFARRFLNFIVPANRPMDNMAAGWDKPQEDEFAILNLGLPSPYEMLAFPNESLPPKSYLTIDTLPPADLAHWKDELRWFLIQVQHTTRCQRLVLKSPTHTARIKTLLEMFPDARFVHIVRDPHVVFPSTVHLWKTLYRRHGLQVTEGAHLDEYVLDTFNVMYEHFERDRSLIPAGHFCELKYEELVRDPAGSLRSIYQQLGLDGFEQVIPRLNEYLAAVDGYQTNQYELTDEQRQLVDTRWKAFLDRYDYVAN